MRLGTLLLLAGAVWLIYKGMAPKVAVNPATGLPTDAVLAQSGQVAGQTANVSISASGYYVQIVNAGGTLTTQGPFTQAQATAAISVSNTVGNVLSQVGAVL